ncbi:MAG: potassium channel protein [Bdellovibrionota bacterium]
MYLTRAIKIVLMLLTLPVIGSLAFMLIEGWNFSDSLYMAVITLTTVGFQEVHPLSLAGRWVVIIYLIFGLGAFLYGVTQIGEFILRAELRNIMGKRRMEKEIKKLSSHHIISGYGRMGEALFKSLSDKGEKLVVIERDQQRYIEMQNDGLICIHGDTTDDRILIKAGIERAKGIAVVLSHDADNLYVVMSSRLLNKDIQILSRASDEKNEAKMLRAGANRVVSPYKSGAARMAQLLVNPHLNDFIEIFDAEGSEFDLAQIAVNADAECLGKRLSQSDFTSRGIVIVGIRKYTGNLLMPPHRDTVIELNDTLIAMGRAMAIQELIHAH